MSWLPRRETCAPWLFFALGIFLIHWNLLVIDDLMHLRRWSFILFPNTFAGQAFFMGFAILALLPASGLCFVTGWALRRRASWARWTGLFPCVYLLLGFPWLTIAGAAGLYLLWTQPVESSSPQKLDYWNPQRQSIWFAILSVLGWGIARQGIRVFQIYGRPLGLPNLDNDHTPILVLFLLVWLHIAFHESGHALAAWMVGFRLKAFGIGPLDIRKDAHGYHFRFEWRRLLLSGGYMGAVPVSEVGIWRKQILVVAAGPLASFAGGVAFGLLFFLLPGTSLAAYWHHVAIGSILGVYLGVTNLVPLGYTDGTMLFHLILRTHRGEELIAKILESQNRQAAAEHKNAGDYQKSAALAREALQRLIERGETDPNRLAYEYLALGHTQLAAEQWRDAEQHLRKALDLLADGAPDASLESGAWTCLHRIYLYLPDVPSADQAYRKALEANESLRSKLSKRGDQLRLHLSTAELHLSAHAFEPALAETEHALAGFPEDPGSRFLMGQLLSARAHAAMQSGEVAFGLHAAEEAANIFRSYESADGVETAQSLGQLGERLWNGGYPDEGITLITESLRLLEPRAAVESEVRLRVFLASVLRAEGRLEEAERALPELERVGPDMRKDYLTERGAIRRKGRKWPEALADASEALRITLTDTPGDDLAIAMAKNAVAEAYLDAGHLMQAELLAKQAYAVLSAAGHPERTDTCITLAVIGWQKQQSTGDYFEEALRIWETAPLILRANKARTLEYIAERLERAGLPEEATRCREDSARVRFPQRKVQAEVCATVA